MDSPFLSSAPEAPFCCRSTLLSILYFLWLPVMLFYSNKWFSSYFQRICRSFSAFLMRNLHWCAFPSLCRVPQYRRPSCQRELWAAGPDPGSALDQWKYSGLRWGPAAYHRVWIWCRSFLCQPADTVTLLWGQPLEQLYQRCNFYFTWHGVICQTLFGILTLPAYFFPRPFPEGHCPERHCSVQLGCQFSTGKVCSNASPQGRL